MTAAACGGSTPSASHSPTGQHTPVTPSASAPAPATTPSPTPSPVQPAEAYAVLVGPLTGSSYTVSLVGIDGRIAASATASTPAAVSCANAAGAVVPLPVSTSNTRLYYMDAQGVVRFLAPSGDTGRATSVPAGTASRRAMFAVSPDDQRIAVVVDDFTSVGASTSLYVEDLAGGTNRVSPYSQSGAFTLWPVGWHGVGNLVVAKVPACSQGGGPFSAGPQELHVIDPATAARRFIVGGSGCLIAGPPSPGGVLCETTVQATKMTWTGQVVRSYPIEGYAPAYISPNGLEVAITQPSGDTLIEDAPYHPIAAMQPCGWIDDTHLIAGGDPQSQPRVADVTTGKIVPVAAQGSCGGRIPGSL